MFELGEFSGYHTHSFVQYNPPLPINSTLTNPNLIAPSMTSLVLPVMFARFDEITKNCLAGLCSVGFVFICFMIGDAFVLDCRILIIHCAACNRF